MLVFGVITLLGGGPKEVYLVSSLQKFFPNPPKSVSEEFGVSYSNWDTKKTLWSTGEVQGDYLKVCPNALMIGCSWVRSWGIDSLKTDPTIRQKVSPYTTSSNNNTIVIVVVVVVVVIVLMFWQPWRPKAPPMSDEEMRQADSDLARQLEIRDRWGAIMERRKRNHVPFWAWWDW